MKKIEKFVFIITYGRSGSTVLMRLLNLIDDSDIKGENYNFLYHIYKAYDAAIRTQENANELTKTNLHAWYGANLVNVEKLKVDLLKIFLDDVLVPRPGIRVGGFKEIRYFDIFRRNEKELERYIGFIEDIFENAYFVFNTRKPEEVANSSWWKNQPPSEIIPEFERFNQWAKEYVEKKGGFLVHYNDLLDTEKRKKITDGLYEYLDERKPPEEKIDEVFRIKSKYSLKKDHKK